MKICTYFVCIFICISVHMWSMCVFKKIQTWICISSLFVYTVLLPEAPDLIFAISFYNSRLYWLFILYHLFSTSETKVTKWNVIFKNIFFCLCESLYAIDFTSHILLEWIFLLTTMFFRCSSWTWFLIIEITIIILTLPI